MFNKELIQFFDKNVITYHNFLPPAILTRTRLLISFTSDHYSLSGILCSLNRSLRLLEQSDMTDVAAICAQVTNLASAEVDRLFNSLRTPNK